MQTSARATDKQASKQTNGRTCEQVDYGEVLTLAPSLRPLEFGPGIGTTDCGGDEFLRRGEGCFVPEQGASFSCELASGARRQARRDESGRRAPPGGQVG